MKYWHGIVIVIVLCMAYDALAENAFHVDGFQAFVLYIFAGVIWAVCSSLDDKHRRGEL